MLVRCLVRVLFHGLLVAAYPTNDGVGEVLVTLPVEGVAAFTGTAPATGNVAILGHGTCEYLPAFNPAAQILRQKLGNERAQSLTEDKNYSLPGIPDNAMLGVTLADAIMANTGSEIDAKLAEIDAFVAAELGSLGPIIRDALTNAEASNSAIFIDSSLEGMESEISTELSKLDEFIDSELAKAEEQIKYLINNSETETDEQMEQIETALTKQEALVETVLAILKSFVEAELAKSEALVNSELEKVNKFVETELEKVGTRIESETAKVDSCVDAELSKMDDNVQSEVSQMESNVERNLKQTESLVKSELEKVHEFVETEHAKTNALVKFELSKIESLITSELGNIDMGVEGVELAVDELSDSFTGEYVEAPIFCIPQPNEIVEYDDTVPVTGGAVIYGSTGCPPIGPTLEPLPLYCESYPVLESADYGEVTEYVPYLPPIDVCYSPPTVPTVGAAKPFIEVKPAYDNRRFSLSRCDMQSAGTEILYHKTQLPMVNVLLGTARVTGSVSVFADFPCPPLTAKETGPDGKKYIWIKK